LAATFTFPSDRPVDLVGFAWSPLFEAALSLRAVVEPKRAPLHLPWVRRCRDLLPADLQAEIRALFRPFGGSFVPGIFEVGLLGDSPAFADELEALRALPDQLVAFELSFAYGGIECTLLDEADASIVTDPAYRDRVLRTAPDDHLRQLAEAAFADPSALRERYAAVLERYWDEAFEQEWQRILPRIEADATAGARALVTKGLGGVVAELLPEGRWDPERRAMVVAKDWEGSCDVQERGGLLFVPTVYGWPCVLIDLAEPWPAAIYFPLRDLRTPEVPQASDHEVVTGFSALGDETRLQIARLVAEAPRSTKELAQLLSLSDSAVSRHLKILEAAGIVSGRRDGYFVLYRLEAERLDVLGRALRATLGLLGSPSGDVPALPVSMPRAR
jgi:DNA-binding transcriptional ArsR family regulator